MKKMRTTRWITITALVAANVLAAAKAQALGDPDAAETNSAEIRQEKIALRYTPPGLILWWLDPVHNAQPAYLKGLESVSGNLKPQARATVTVAPPSKSVVSSGKQLKWEPFQLPEGVVELHSTPDFSDGLLARGTLRGIRELRTIVALLDRPVQQVQIEVRVVEVPAGVFITSAVNAETSVIGVGIQKEAELQELLKLKQARILHDSRVSTPNNTTAILNFESSSLAIVQTEKDGATTKQPAVLTDSLRIALTPTINRDNTITVVANISRMLRTSDGAPLPGFAEGSLSASAINSIANSKSGETQMVSGLQSDKAPKKSFAILPLGADNDAKPTPDEQSPKQIIVLITPSVATNGAMAANP